MLDHFGSAWLRGFNEQTGTNAKKDVHIPRSEPSITVNRIQPRSSEEGQQHLDSPLIAQNTTIESKNPTLHGSSSPPAALQGFEEIPQNANHDFNSQLGPNQQNLENGNDGARENEGENGEDKNEDVPGPAPQTRHPIDVLMPQLLEQYMEKTEAGNFELADEIRRYTPVPGQPTRYHVPSAVGTMLASSNGETAQSGSIPVRQSSRIAMKRSGQADNEPSTSHAHSMKKVKRKVGRPRKDDKKEHEAKK